MKLKFRRAAITIAVLVCLLAMNMNATFGLEDIQNEETVTVSDGTAVTEKALVPGEVPPTGEATVTEPPVTEPPVVTDSTSTTEPDPNLPENPDENQEPNQPDNPDENQDPNPPENPDVDPDPNQPGNPDGNQPTEPDANQPENPGENQEPNQPGNPNENQPADPQPSQPAEPAPAPDNSGQTVTQPDEEAATGQDRVIQDTNKDAVYTGNLYKPSDLFLDNRDKIKYNVAIPIDGIPSFITQEMIIGALKCQDETGFPASVTIAQIIQESGFGKYGPEGEKGMGLSYLAYQYNNLFGIKGKGPAGSVDMRTGEQTPAGESYMTTAGFRVYNTYTESIEDRTKLLKEVYSDLIKDTTDANTFAMRIGGRWATDIHYAQSLIKQMETYDLYRLDKLTVQSFSDMIGAFANPCPGSALSSPFGWRNSTGSFHKGLDLGTGTENIPTYAAEAGTVIVAGWSDSAGNWIVIDHGNGIVTKYMHHDKIYVKEGQHVEKGQQIGLTGNTGHSFGNHLHFQVEENGAAVDPAPYLGIENK